MKCGNKLYKSIEIPLNAKIETAPSGREYYVCGLCPEGVNIKYLDNNEYKTISNEKYKRR